MSHLVGFTGTRSGCTPEQHETLRHVLFEQSRMSFAVLVHGCCVGADREAHAIWRRHRGKVRFRPGDKRQNAWAEANCLDFESIFGPVPHLQRNRTIADECAVLVACPAEPVMVLRSGTWATVRAAERLERRTIIILPSGEIAAEGAPVSLAQPSAGSEPHGGARGQQ